MKRGRWYGRLGAGFSMIELLAVAAILLLLFTLYWGSGASESQLRRVQKDCQSQLQRLYVSLSIYANEHDGHFPVASNALTPAQGLAVLVPRYTVDTSLFLCPGVKNAPAQAELPFREHRISYAYYMGRRVTDNAVLMSDAQDNPARSAGIAAFSSTSKAPGNNHGKIGGNFLFCDGRAEASAPRVPFSLGPTQGIVLLNP